jgi:hypothetical protein
MLDRVAWHGSPVSTRLPSSEGLVEWLAEVRDNPPLFVLGAFPWGEAGTPLAKFDGPLEWQWEVLSALRDGLLTPQQAIMRATASGHGIGKSALVAMIIIWAMMTFPDTKGVITANTETQLKTKTWAELGRWFNLCWFSREYFVLNATSLVSKDPERERTWRVDMIPWSKTNPQAFAGLHNSGKRQFMIFDEASEIEDIIWETAEGFLTDIDAQRFWLAFGNPTKNSGRFRECFEGGAHHDMWITKQIDSRTVPITDRAYQDKLIRAYGADSDYVRIRILGQFPRKGLMEFFSASEIDAAMSPTKEVFVDALTPLAMGVDVARYGANNSVIFPRKGRDARSIPRKIFNGLNTVELSSRVFDCWTEWHPDGIFVDGGGVGGGVVDQCRSRHLFVWEIQFGAKDSITGVANDTTGERYANMRAAMYGALRAWLKTGMLPNDTDLRTAMLSIRYTFNRNDEIQLVSKEDLLEDNPGLVLDDLDALALTFGGPLAPHKGAGREGPQPVLHQTEYNPFDPKMLDVGVSQQSGSTWDPFTGTAN